MKPGATDLIGRAVQNLQAQAQLVRMQAIQRLQAAQAAGAAALPSQQNPGFERAANGLGGLGGNPLGGNPMGNPLGGGAAPAGGGLERFFPGGAPGGGLPMLPLQVCIALSLETSKLEK